MLYFMCVLCKCVWLCMCVCTCVLYRSICLAMATQYFMTLCIKQPAHTREHGNPAYKYNEWKPNQSVNGIR